ncbi:MAG: DNA alkylation repair protein [Chloroflexia bacterium]|nr:DNA alkylation repair protein [Chloroflexia bacterium]
MTERQRFKDHFDARLAHDLVTRLSVVAPSFPAEAFTAQVVPQLAPLELKARVTVFAQALRDHLPADYPLALSSLLAILGPPHREDQGMFNDGWYLMPVAAFIERYGLDHLEESLDGMHALTQRHTAEFAIRPFLVRYPDEVLARLHQWATDESFHVRRLVSEGTRTRLPWATRLEQFIVEPTPVLGLLEHLKDDPSAYVRRSVANNLNDLAKDHPERVVATLSRWREGANAQRLALIRHALRTLVKQGHPDALHILGAGSPEVSLIALTVTPASVPIGDTLQLAVQIENTSTNAQQLVIDYILHLVGARGERRRKVFKWATRLLEPGATLILTRRHSFAPVTVRRYYPGAHQIELQINGAILGDVTFMLEQV